MNELTTLENLFERITPFTVFDAEISDVREWADLPQTFTVTSLVMYLLHKYGKIAVKNYDNSELTTLTTLWHSANYYRFSGLAATTKQEYNPIENYNRTETESVERTPDLTTETERTETPRVTTTETATRTPDLTDTDTDARTFTDSGTTATAGETDQTIAATAGVMPYDSAVFHNATTSDAGKFESSETITHGKKTTNGGTLTHTTTGQDETVTTRTATGTNTDAETRTETGTDTTERETHISGNIGVTTTQEMLEQERKIVNFVFLDEYVSAWVNAFCVGVWL